MSHRQLIFVSCRISSLPAPQVFFFDPLFRQNLWPHKAQIKLHFRHQTVILLTVLLYGHGFHTISRSSSICSVQGMPPRYGKISVLHSIWYPVPPLYAPRTLFAASVQEIAACAVPRISSHISSSTHGRYCARCSFPFFPLQRIQNHFFYIAVHFMPSSSPGSMRRILIPDVISHLQYQPSLRYIAITVPGDVRLPYCLIRHSTSS